MIRESQYIQKYNEIYINYNTLIFFIGTAKDVPNEGTTTGE